MRPADRPAGLPSRPPSPTCIPASGQARPARGAVLLGFLVLLAASGWTVARWSQAAADERQREAEAELLWVGQQYRQAIEAYYNATPGGVKKLPLKVEDLLEDKRFPTSRRHLRQAYGDPLRPGQPLKLILRAEQLVGVRSEATGLPFRRTGFPTGLEKFSEAASYTEWEFIANVRGLANLPGAQGSASTGGAGGAGGSAGSAGSTGPFGSGAGGDASSPVGPTPSGSFGSGPRGGSQLGPRGNPSRGNGNAATPWNGVGNPLGDLNAAGNPLSPARPSAP